MKRGDLICVRKWAKVENAHRDSVTCVDVDLDEDFQINGKRLINQCSSADQFEETKKLSMTDLAQLLPTLRNTPFTVEFIKQDGNARTLRGRFISEDKGLGRSMVHDLDKPHDGNRTRLVDHRTITRIIANNTEYVLK